MVDDEEGEVIEGEVGSLLLAVETEVVIVGSTCFDMMMICMWGLRFKVVI